MTRQLSLLLGLSILLTTCNSEPSTPEQENSFQTENTIGRVFDLPGTEILVLATFHFRNSDQYEVLENRNQSLIDSLLEKLAVFKPTKVILEWQPRNAERANQNYQKFLDGEFDINDRENEGYQLGYQLAKKMGHEQVYLFDDQTEFIGSLEDFSFSSFEAYAQENDDGFYNKYDSLLTVIFQSNQALSDSLNLYEYIKYLNSPNNERFNVQRMHLREVKVGIQESWIGPDWLGRWYQRNVRMFANVLAMENKPEDRLLIIVGDNHKWVLDMLFEFSAEFKVVQPSEFL